MSDSLNTPPVSKETTLPKPVDSSTARTTQHLKEETPQLITNWKILELEKRLLSTEKHFEQRISELTTLIAKLFSSWTSGDEVAESEYHIGPSVPIRERNDSTDSVVRSHYLKWESQLPSLQGMTRVLAYRRLTRFKNVIIDHDLLPKYVLEYLQKPENLDSRILITTFYHTLEINLFLSWIALEKDLEKLPKTPVLLDCIEDSIIYWKQETTIHEGINSLIEIVDTFVDLGSHINWHSLFQFFATHFSKLIHKAVSFTNLRALFLEFEPKLRNTLELNLKSEIYYGFWNQFGDCLRNASLNSAVAEERALSYFAEASNKSVNLDDLIYHSMV